MINVTQSLDALIQIDGISDIYETFNNLHSESFIIKYKGFKCNVSFTNSMFTICLMSSDCSFKRSWSLKKQESEESFRDDVKFFLEDSARKMAA